VSGNDHLDFEIIQNCGCCTCFSFCCHK